VGYPEFTLEPLIIYLSWSVRRGVKNWFGMDCGDKKWEPTALVVGSDYP